MAKTPTPRPLEIPYFGTGFYTYRSQLFQPFRSMGVNIVSFHDAVLAGADMELSDLMEWVQRPGFTVFCTEPLSTGEIINQFYSARALNGTLLTMFDSNERLATFNGTTITTLYTKNTSAQGFINQVGNTTYFYDGVDAVRYDQTYGLTPNGIAAPTSTVDVSDTGGWLPDQPYAAGSVLLDYNGNVEYAANVSAGTSLLQDNTGVAAVNGTWWETVNGGAQWRTTGFATSGSYITPINSFIAQGFGFSLPTNAVILGVQVVFGTVAQFTTGANIVGASLFYNGAAIGTTRDPATPFLTITQTQTYGLSNDTWGATLTPAIVNDPSFGFGLSVQLYNQRVFIDAPFEMRVYYFIPTGTGGTAGVSGSTLPNWSALPGSYTTDGTMRWNNLGVMGQWIPLVAYTIPSVILDSNNNLQSVSVITAVAAYNNGHTYHSGDVVTYAGQYWTAQATITGVVPNSSVANVVTSGGTATYNYNWIQTPNPQTSGATVPVWNTVVGGQTNDGNLVWTNIGPGNILVNAGYSYGVCYRTMDGHLSTMSVPVPNQGTGPLLGGSPLATSNISSFSITSNIVTFISQQTFTKGEAVYVQGMLQGTYLNDHVFTVASAIPSASYSITNVALTSNVVTFTAVNSLAAGTQVTIQSLTGAAFLNGQTLTVASATGTTFTANFTHANYGSAGDAGTAIVVAQFTTGFTHADVASTPDVGTVNPVIATLNGTGTSDPRLQYVTNITEVAVTGNQVTLTCNNIFFPGNTILVTDLSLAAFLNDFTLLIATATPTQITAYFQTPDYPATPDTGLATFMGIEIYRTADGGGIWYQVGVAQPNQDSVTALPSSASNSGLGIPWQVTSELIGTGTGTGTTAAITNIALTSNVVTLTTSNQSFTAGQVVTVSNMGNNTFLNGANLTVLASGLTSTSFSAAFTHGNVSSVADAGFVSDNTAFTYAANQPYVTPGAGQYVVYCPAVDGSGALEESGLYFGTPWSFYGSQRACSGNGGKGLSPPTFSTTSSTVAVPTLPAGATVVGIYPYATGAKGGSIGSAAVVTFTANYNNGSPHSYGFSLNGTYENAGNIGTNLAYLNTLTFTTFAEATLIGDGGWYAGVGSYGAAVVYTISGGTPPSSTALQQLNATAWGNFNTAASVQGIELRFNAGDISTLSPPQAANITVQLTLDGAPVGTVQNITLSNWAQNFILGNPNYIWGLSSLTGAQLTGGGMGFIINGNLPTNSQINMNAMTAQIFYTDGTWTFVDIYTDQQLNEQLVAPIAHLNDPPPGQLGSIASPFVGGTLCAYWQGRQWLAQGQFLYFDAGADCLNGDPHQSWPPGNRFEYPGTIVGIAALDHGLVVLGADYFGVALGGPQTLTFYPLVISKNFGISSPNAMYQDGQTLHVLTTQGQLFEITNGERELEGHVVADYIASTFPPASSYLTMHRNGNDVGLFMGNGSTTMLRYGSNIGAWSVPAYPVGGFKAMGSIETSIGTYSLCIAPASAPLTSPPTPNYIMARNLNAWADTNGPYTSAFSPNGVGIVIGSITLSGPGEALEPVQHILGYFDAAGVGGAVDVPTISLLPNEISAATSVTGWITLPTDQVVPEPPIGTIPSTSLQSLRYPVSMWNSQASQYMHHLQIRLVYPNTDAPHTIKALAIKFDQS
jgi:hypothetical protein